MFARLWNNMNDWFNDKTAFIKEFFLEHSRNVFIWIVIILAALIIFEWLYRKLHKED